MSRAAILVLGMHRSGTSALTWLLGRLGAKLPNDAIDPHDDNARGYFESAGLVKADDQVLRVARSSWFDPRPLDLSRLWPSAIRSRKDRIKEAIERGWGNAPLLAIKDPRQCRFVPLVAEVLGEMGIEARAVLMLRAPADIARSLASRDGTSPTFGHLLWLRHMIDAERATRGMPRAILSYDAMLEDWRGAIALLAPLAGLSPLPRAGGAGSGPSSDGARIVPTPDPFRTRKGRWEPNHAQATEIDAFLDPGLRHHRSDAPTALEQPLAGIVAAVVAGLDALISADGEVERARLDEAYALLDAAPWLEGDIVHEELRHRRMSVAEEEVQEQEPDPVAPLAEPAPPPEPSEDADLIRGSGIFDADWYRATYPDVGDHDPADHYVRIGAPRGYNPNPLFDTGYYARQMARRIA